MKPLIATVENKRIRVIQSNEFGDGTFVGRCKLERRNIDDFVRAKIFMPPGPRQEAYRYWKFLNWVEIDLDDLNCIRSLNDDPEADFEICRADFNV